MNKFLLIGCVLGTVALATGGAVAGLRAWRTPHADVVAVKPLQRTVRIPRQECHDEQVTRVKTPRDGNRLAGTGIGAVVGGLLGTQVGGGSGKVLATVAGAAAGGYAGNKIEQKVQGADTYTTTEQRCDTVYDSREVPDGYEVTYALNGTEHRVHMDHDPGKTLPVENGRVRITALHTIAAPRPPRATENSIDKSR